MGLQRVRHDWATSLYFASLHCSRHLKGHLSQWSFPDMSWLGLVLIVFHSTCCVCMCLVTQLCSTFWDPVDCSPPGFSVDGGSPGKNAGVGCHALFQGIFPTQGLNLGLPHCRWILYHLSHQGSLQHSVLLYHKPVLLHLRKKKCVSHSGLPCPQNIRSLGEEHWIFNLCILSA